MTTERDPHTSQATANPGIGEVTITIRDRHQRHDKIPPSRISETNPDQIRLILQYSTDLGIEIPVTIYPTKKSSQLPTTVTNQTQFDSPQQTIQLMKYLDYALYTTEKSYKFSSPLNQCHIFITLHYMQHYFLLRDIAFI